MATQLVYLDGFDVVSCRATVMAVQPTADQRVDIELDKTCFYPRGGGQDWDTGTIKTTDGSIVFEVQEVRIDDNGIVHHFGVYKTGKLQVGAKIDGQVDITRRSINTRLHSAAHVVDLAVDRLKLPWTPGRGGHYPHMSFVEYEGVIAPEEIGKVRERIQEIVNQVITQGGQNKIRFMPVSEMHTVCRHVPANIPTNKPARVVIYHGNFGVPCGGTHVADLRNIGQVVITKIKTKKGLTKVSYAVEGID